MKNYPVPENWPRGYSWVSFTQYGNKTLEDLESYIKRSTYNTEPSDILKNMKDFFEIFPEALDTPAGWCCKYIFDHPEIHHMLVHVNDGSFRKNKIYLQGVEPIFINHELERFYQNLAAHTWYNTEEPCNEGEAVELLEEIIEEDQVIFIQFGSVCRFDDIDDPMDDPVYAMGIDPNDDYYSDDYDDDYWDDGCSLEDI